VFLDRQLLRDFLRGLVSGETRSRVLVVNGPAGSGKSYTGVLADSVARATGRLACRRFELSGVQSGMTFIGSIFDAFQWRGDMISPATAEPMHRHLADLANVVRRKAEESRAVILIDVDISEEPLAETRDFLGMLVSEPGRLALILSGFRPEWVPAAAQTAVVYEALSDLTLQDVEDGLSRVFRQTGRAFTQEQLRQVANGVLAGVMGGADFNRQCNKSVKQLLAKIAGADFG
jgi:hypothetical protein